MASKTSVVVTGDTITVHDPKLLEEIFGPSQGDLVKERVGAATTAHSKTSASTATTIVTAPRPPPAKNLSVKPMKKKGKVVFDPRTLEEIKAVQKACADVVLEEKCLMQEIDEFLRSESSRYEYKRGMLYQKWLNNVFDPLLTKLHSFMNNGGYDRLHAKKTALFNDYLDYRNNKMDVFLDTLTTEECSPAMLVEQIKALQKVSSPELDDPLTAQASDYCTEQRLVQDFDRGRQGPHSPSSPSLPPSSPSSPGSSGGSPLGRQDTECSLWLAMQLVDIDSSLRRKSQLRQKGIQTQSVVHPAEWHQGEVTPQSIKEELDIPHKKDVPHNTSTLRLSWDGKS